MTRRPHRRCLQVQSLSDDIQADAMRGRHCPLTDFQSHRAQSHRAQSNRAQGSRTQGSRTQSQNAGSQNARQSFLKSFLRMILTPCQTNVIYHS